MPAVQSVDADLKFFKRVYKKQNGGRFHRLREDFCGTAALACAWVRSHRDNVAFGVDLDPEPLAWSLRHNVFHQHPSTLYQHRRHRHCNRLGGSTTL